VWIWAQVSIDRLASWRSHLRPSHRSEAMAVLRTLIVDDQSAQRELLGGFLRHLGYAVVEAKDGVDAVSRVREGRFDLVLLDQQMPRLGGIDAIQPLKNLQPDIVVVVITAFGTPDEASRALEAGAAAYLLKPLDLGHLEKVLREVLGRCTSQ
jgi:CheY-like chemotaxis protein